VTGISGQDGAHLAQFLLLKGYEAHGVIRRSSHRGVEDHRLRWLGIADKLHLHDGDRGDVFSLIRITEEVKPKEICNLAAESFVVSSSSSLASSCLLLASTNPDGECHGSLRRQHARGDAHRRATGAFLSSFLLRNVWPSRLPN